MYIWCLTSIRFAKTPKWPKGRKNQHKGWTAQTVQQRQKSFPSQPLASSWRGRLVFSQEAAHTKPKLQHICAVRAWWNSHQGHGKPFIHLPLLLRTHSFLRAEGKKATVGSLPLRFPLSPAPFPIGGNAKKKRVGGRWITVSAIDLLFCLSRYRVSGRALMLERLLDAVLWDICAVGSVKWGRARNIQVQKIKKQNDQRETKEKASSGLFVWAHCWSACLCASVCPQPHSGRMYVP